MSEERTQRITLTHREGFKFIAEFDDKPDRPAVLLDEPPPLGQGAGPNAAALLATAVGNCLAASLLFCLRKSRVDVNALSAQVSVRIGRNEKGRFRVTGIDVELAPGVADDAQPQLQRCAELFEQFCVVTDSVRKGIPVSVTLKTPGGTFSV